MSDSISSPERDGPSVQAHRGFAGISPENTVLAARTAADRFGVGWIEIDVVPTADGTVVCFHDDGLGGKYGRGVTDAEGVVWETPTERVLSAELLASGETVPSFVDILDALPTDIGLNVELKNPGTGAIEPDVPLSGDDLAAARDRWDDFVDAVVEHVDGTDRPLVFSSACEGAIAAAGEHALDVPTAVIVRYDLADGLAIAERHDADAVNARGSLLLEARESFVAERHEADIAVNAWTVREWTEARDLAALGVNGLIADYPFLDATL